MNILVLFGSPRRNGNTKKLVSAFLKGFSKDDDIDIVNLFELMPTPCNACGYCKASDGCSKKDLDGFMKKYFEADLIVVATPIYLMSMPAPLKALFDRFQRFYEARFKRNIEIPIEKSKKAVILVTAGCDGKIGFKVIEEQIKSAFSVMNTKVVATLLVNDTDKNDVTENDLLNAYGLSSNL
ncbi:MAG: flavodoxin family protein [Oscillospiraceae bacterium]